ncbi:hypothetical protein DB88DRAFT_479960 [Papiliotrema laurentii]|uniref:Uncharacterized protein n=1 Tax=Papiliotrema laurentii TaxID=5418 RepID=A0AAD9FXB3_PAPLA|nr:hypothetical protein DB88DRAFT_479960 [Papiliotrema laurentii]
MSYSGDEGEESLEKEGGDAVQAMCHVLSVALTTRCQGTTWTERACPCCIIISCFSLIQSSHTSSPFHPTPIAHFEAAMVKQPRSASPGDSSPDSKPRFSSPLTSAHSTSSPTPSPTKKAKTTSKGEGVNATRSERKPDVAGGFTTETRGALIDHLIALGLKSSNVEALAEEFGVTKTQLRNATQMGRKGNLRDKAVKAARGD